MTEEQLALQCLYYVQKFFFHNQVSDSYKCGDVARELSNLLDKNEIENRIVKLIRHTVVEAKWDKKWHVLDADIFRHGIVLRKDNGEIPAIWELQGNYLIDKFPPTQYVYTREYKEYLKLPVKCLRLPSFYEPHEVGFISYYYQMNSGLPLEFPPERPKNLKSVVNGQEVVLYWDESKDIDNDITGYRVMINIASREWSYYDPVYEKVPSDTSNCFIFSDINYLKIKLKKGIYFWSVKAIDEHIKKEKDTYYFPSEEYWFEV